MNDTNIDAAATPRKSRSFHITTFRERDEWIKLLLAADGDELSSGAKIVGARIALHRNVETGQCNPSLAQLAAGTGMSVRNVRRMLRELEELDWIGTDQSGGRHAHSFALRVPNSTEETDEETGINPDNSVRDDVSNPDECVRVHDNSTRTTVSGIPGQDGYSNPDTVVRQKSEENNEENSEGVKDSPPLLDLEGGGGVDPIGSSFEVWYKQYPKHADKPDALRAYRNAVKKKLATPEQLLAAAMRYSAERAGQDPKFTKNPATWLNKQSWLNEPASTGATYGAAPPPGHSHHIDVSAAIARQLMERKAGHG